MSPDHCPHCGDKLRWVRDAFCGECGELIDEPPPAPRTPEEQQAFRKQVEAEAKEGIRRVGWLWKFFR